MLPLFKKKEADRLNKYKSGIDLKIELKKGLNGKDFPLFFGLLYNIFWEELLVLKKILKDLLEKGFICESSSEAGVLILFIRKSGGRFRFYYDYCTLNIVIRADRYPLLLIREIFRILKGIK